MRLRWYLDRISRMSAREISSRAGVAIRQRYWADASRRPRGLRSVVPGPRTAAVALPRPDILAAPAVIRAADELLAGRWPLFHLRPAIVGERPDWFRDPASGIASTPGTYAFAVPYRDEAAAGNAKYVWELSRHQATTVLASAWWLTGHERYAERVRAHLTSWWAENPFLSGIHWTGGIEAGLRLISWVWIRALLADWPGVRALFDDNEAFVGQLYHHLLYIRRLHSRGSSSNNHLIAELAGVVAACAAFPWFREFAAWGAWARAGLATQAEAQTHEDGFNREQASEYHSFVFEILAGTSLATRLAGQPALARVETVMRRMADALASSLDATGRPPRFGDGDDGRGVLLDAPQTHGEVVVLDVARAMFGPAPWWPAPQPTVLGAIAGRLCGVKPARDVARQDSFPGVGMTLLRSGEGRDEIYVRCDAGPHGYLSIAAHGHADALSLEARHGGVDILADPGTYCYHGEPEWRSYFRGTLGHNTLSVDGLDQARIGGPFLWLDRPGAILAEQRLDGRTLSWSARHDGYRRLSDGVTHFRVVSLGQARRTLEIEDWIEAGAAHQVALAFHLGPAVDATLDGASLTLRWTGHSARMHLPTGLVWRAHRGQTQPPLGWYSPGFGQRIPAWTLVGHGLLPPATRLRTVLHFPPSQKASAPCEMVTAAF